MSWWRIVGVQYDKGQPKNTPPEIDSWLHRQQAIEAAHRAAAAELVNLTNQRSFSEPIIFTVHYSPEDDAATIFITDIRGFTDKYIEYTIYYVEENQTQLRYRGCEIVYLGKGVYRITNLFGEENTEHESNGLELLLEKIDELSLERD